MMRASEPEKSATVPEYNSPSEKKETVRSIRERAIFQVQFIPLQRFLF